MPCSRYCLSQTHMLMFVQDSRFTRVRTRLGFASLRQGRVSLILVHIYLSLGPNWTQANKHSFWVCCHPHGSAAAGDACRLHRCRAAWDRGAPLAVDTAPSPARSAASRAQHSAAQHRAPRPALPYLRLTHTAPPRTPVPRGGIPRKSKSRVP
jgi:hypothetical protein